MPTLVPDRPWFPAAMISYTTRQPGDGEYTPVTVLKDVIKNSGSKLSVDGVQGNVTKCIPDICIYFWYLDILHGIWIYSWYLDTLPDIWKQTRYLETSPDIIINILDIWRIVTLWRRECHYLEYRPRKSTRVQGGDLAEFNISLKSIRQGRVGIVTVFSF